MQHVRAEHVCRTFLILQLRNEFSDGKSAISVVDLFHRFNRDPLNRQPLVQRAIFGLISAAARRRSGRRALSQGEKIQ